MSIIPASQVKCQNSRENIVDVFCVNLMDKIQEAAANGRHSCCFDATVYYENSTGRLYYSYQDKWRGKPGAYDTYKYRFDDYQDEVRERFRRAGYVVKHTGCIADVWQLTEEICW